MVALAGEGILGPTCTYLLLSSECFSFYNDIMINAGHDLCLCKMLGDFPKSKVCRHPNHYKEELCSQTEEKTKVQRYWEGLWSDLSGREPA
jgi:hypothetical protein